MHAPGEDQALPDAGTKAMSLDDFGRLFLVSDGVGGLKAGEIASRLTVETIAREVSLNCARGMGTGSESANRVLFRALLKANEIVGEAALASPEQKGMAATLTALWVLPDRTLVGQVGDSRLYRLRGGRLSQITEDQSRVAQLVREGKISPDEAHEHPERNVIDQAVGSDPASFHPIVFSLDLYPDDRFLLCTDGVTDGLDEKAIGAFLGADWTGNLAERVSELVHAALRASGRDNLTAILVEVTGDPHPHPPLSVPPEKTKISWGLSWIGIGASLALFVFLFFKMEERERHMLERMEVFTHQIEGIGMSLEMPGPQSEFAGVWEDLRQQGADLDDIQLWRNRVETLLGDLLLEAADFQRRLPETAEIGGEEHELLRAQLAQARMLASEARHEVDRTRQRLVDLMRQVERLEGDFEFLRDRFNARFPLPSEGDSP